MPDRDTVVSKIETICEICKTNKWKTEFDSYTIYPLLTDALALLKEQADGKPKGHWIPYEPDKRGYTDGFTCSRCERVVLSDHYCKMIDFDFCPYCGANMDNADGW